MMRLVQFTLAFLAILAMPTDKASAEIITINAVATASASFNPNTNSTSSEASDDGILRAYFLDMNRIDGFMRFDLSSLPNTAFINSLTLTLFSDPVFATPNGTPELLVYRSNFDGWTSASASTFTDDYKNTPVMDTAVSLPFPTKDTPTVPYTFTLNPTLASLQNDLLDTDNLLTLVLRTENSLSNNHTYWQGVGAGKTAPSLSVNFTDVSAVPEPSSLALFGISTLVARGVIIRRRRIQKNLSTPV